MPGANVAERAGAPRFPAGEGCAEAERAFCAEPERCSAAAAACRASLSPGAGSMLRRCCSAKSPSVNGAAYIDALVHDALVHWCIDALVRGAWCIGALVHWCVVQWCLVHFGIAGHLRIIVRVGFVVPIDDLFTARLERVSSRLSRGLLVL